MKKILVLLVLLSFIISGFSQTVSQNDLIGTWKGKATTFKLLSDNTYKISDRVDQVLGHWKLEENFADGTDTKIVLSYYGVDLDSKFQVVTVQDEILELKDLSDNQYYTFTKEVKSSYSLTSDDQALLFWGTLGALILFSGDSGGSSSSTFNGEYSSDPNINRHMKNAHEQDARDRGY